MYQCTHTIDRLFAKLFSTLPGYAGTAKPNKTFPKEDANHDTQPTGEGNTRRPQRTLVLPSYTTHTHTFKAHPPTNPQLTPPKVLSQEGFHIAPSVVSTLVMLGLV